MKKIFSFIVAFIAITLCNAQNVGVGIAAPLAPLHVKSTVSEILRVQGAHPYVSLFDNTNGYMGYIWYNGSSVQLGSSNSSGMPVTIAPLVSVSATFAINGNVGIGTTSPTQKLDVNGPVRTSELMVTSGSQSDVLKKGAGDNTVFSKGNNGLGLNYIIAIQGIFPPNGGGGGSYSDIILGEIRLFAGNYAPSGFMFCQGQLLAIASNNALFALLGTTYGGDGVTTFALPDLRAAVPVGFGTTGTGPSWLLGERSN